MKIRYKHFIAQIRTILVWLAIGVLLIVLPVIIFMLTRPTSAKAQWWDDAFLYRLRLSVTNNTTVESNVYITVTLNTSDTSQFQIDCGDLRFTKQSGQLLPYYIVSGCRSTSTVIHILMDTFPAGTQSLYAYFGNSNVSNGFSASDFETAASNYTVGNVGAIEIGPGFSGWWKFDEGEGTSAKDSTQHRNDGSISGATWQTEDTCIHGKCLSFNGTSDVVTVANTSTIDLDGKGIAGSQDMEDGDSDICTGGGGGFTTGMCSSGTAVGNSTSAAYTGQYGLAVSSSANGSSAYGYKDITDTTNPMYFRAMFKANAIGLAGDGSYARILNPETATNNWQTCHFEVKNTSGSYYLTTFTAGNWDPVNVKQITTGTWYELGVYVVPESTDGASDGICKFYIDGEEVDTRTGVDFGTSGSQLGSYTVGIDYMSQSGAANTSTFYFDRIVAAQEYRPDKNVTIEAWIRPNSDGENHVGQIIQKGTNTYIRTANTGSDNLADLEASFDLVDTDATLTVSNVISLNTWHHVALVYSRDSGDGDEISLYIDGKLRGTSANGIGPSTTDTNNLLIGGSTSANYKGFIDDVKFYHYKRTSAEILADVQNSSGVLGTKIQDFLSEGLVGYWKMDETTWTADCTTFSVLDSSGNGLNGRSCPNGTGSVGGGVGKFAQAGVFDGNDDYIRVPNNTLLHLTGAMTLSIWVKPNGAQPDYTRFITKNYVTSYFLGIGTGSGRDLGYWLKNTNVIDTDEVLQDGIWQLVTVTYDGTTARMYLDGKNIATASYTGGIQENSSGLTIGGSAYYFNGNLDEARIYNRALSANEVQNLYQWAPGPVGYWKMDEASWINDCSTGSIQDSSGNGYNGLSCPAGSGPVGGVVAKVGKGGRFDENDDYVLAGGNTKWDSMKNVTVSLWVYNTPTVPADARYLFSKALDTSNRWGLRWTTTNHYLQIYDDIDNAGSIACQVELSDKTWYYVTATLADNGDGTYANQLYVNGISQKCSYNSTGSWSSYAGNVYIGADVTSNSTSNSIIDDVKIYDYVRTPSQIVQDMNSGHPAPGSPIGSQVIYWKLDEQNGGTVYNSISTQEALTGTITGATWKTKKDCKYNGCLSAASTTDTISAGDVSFVDSLASMSASLWVYPTTLATDKAIITKSNFSDQNVFAVVTDSTNSDEVRIYIASSLSDTSNYVTTTNFDLATNSWQQLSIVYDGYASANERLKVYKNGKQVATTVTGTISSVLLTGSSSNFKVGASDSGSYTALLGMYDDFKLYPYVLTNSQIALDTNAGASLNLSNGSSEEAQIVDGAGNPPVLYYDFNQNSGTTTVYDKSGRGHDGIMGGNMTQTSWVPGIYGSALHFDGTNDTVQVATHNDYDITADESFSVSLWFNTRVVNALSPLEKGTAPGWRLRQQTSNGTIFFQVRDGTTNVQVNSLTTTAIYDGKWHQVTAVLNRADNTLKLYIDGILQESKDVSVIGSLSNAQDLEVSYKSDIWNGNIDEVKIFDYALTPAQVAYNFNRGAPIAWWKMDECEGTTIHDASGNKHNGTWSGSGGGTQTTVGTCSSSGTAWGNGSSGKYNGSLNFDSTDDYVDIDSSASHMPSGTSNVSVAAWVKPNVVTSAKSIITYGGTALSSGYGLGVGTVSAKANISINGTYYSGNTTLTTGQWYHIVGVYDHNTVKLYVNGKLDASTSLSSSITASSTLRIGMEPSSSMNYDGIIDDVRIYNYALSADQVKQVANGGAAVRWGP